MAIKQRNARTAEPSSQQAKRRLPKKKRAQKRQPRKSQSKPLPPPVELESEARKEPEPQKQNGFLESVGSLFVSQPKESPGPSVHSSPPQTENENHSSKSSGSGSALPADTERKLDAVPDVIGDDPIAAQEGSASLSADDFSSLLDAIAFEEQDVRDVLEETFEWLSERFESDHWKLTDRQARMLCRPTAQLLNSIWVKLRDRLPEVLARWCESTPGAAAFLTAFGIVVVPKAMKQVTLSRAKKKIAEPEKIEPLTSSHPMPPAQPHEVGEPWTVKPHR